jgi:ubiquinone/menaquinone biosynthesis C-methylase UbiE
MTEKNLTPFVHPITKAPLLRTPNGSLSEDGTEDGEVIRCSGNSWDFVVDSTETEERAYYDAVYDKLACNVPPLRLSSIMSEWHEESAMEAFLARLGNLSGKRVLLLGNGASLKELYFVHAGANVVFTDLSISAVRLAESRFSESDIIGNCSGQIEFHAIDALHLPFQEDTFDVVYGCKFVHHIQDLDPFFCELRRCLKPGGRCIFFDDAKSDLWHCMKNTILKPLQLLSHWIYGISPEDRAATKKGGFTKPELETLMKRHRFGGMTFERRAFLEYMVQRGAMKLFGWPLRIFTPIARWLDRTLLGEGFLSRYGVRLIWGFEKA